MYAVKIRKETMDQTPNMSIFTGVIFPVFNFARENQVYSQHVWQKIENGGCFTNLF